MYELLGQELIVRQRREVVVVVVVWRRDGEMWDKRGRGDEEGEMKWVSGGKVQASFH